MKNNSTNPKIRNGREVLPLVMRQRQIVSVLHRTGPRSSADLAAAIEVEVSALYRFVGPINDKLVQKRRILRVDVWDLTPEGKAFASSKDHKRRAS